MGNFPLPLILRPRVTLEWHPAVPDLPISIGQHGPLHIEGCYLSGHRSAELTGLMQMLDKANSKRKVQPREIFGKTK
jgi:hypothetical protein